MSQISQFRISALIIRQLQDYSLETQWSCPEYGKGELRANPNLGFIYVAFPYFHTYLKIC